jgi:hypothetical protein
MLLIIANATLKSSNQYNSATTQTVYEQKAGYNLAYLFFITIRVVFWEMFISLKQHLISHSVSFRYVLTSHILVPRHCVLIRILIASIKFYCYLGIFDAISREVV